MPLPLSARSAIFLLAFGAVALAAEGDEECVVRGPVCSWFPGGDAAVFVGKVVESSPGPADALVDKMRRMMESRGISMEDAENDTVPEHLIEGMVPESVVAFLDYLGAAISAESREKLASVTNNEEFSDWMNEYFDAPTRTVRFEVVEVFAGEVGASFEASTDLGLPGDCGLHFGVGESYLVVAHGGDGEWRTDVWAGTRDVKDAEEDLEYLRTYGVGSPNGKILGRVVGRNRASDNAEISVPGADVFISNGARTLRLASDRNGLFESSDLPPGSYTVWARYRGRPASIRSLDQSRPVDADFSAALTLLPKACKRLIIDTSE